MDPKTRIVAVGGSLAILLFVVDLVRRRKLKEEYSVLWTVTALTLLLMAVVPSLLDLFTKAVGAVLASSALFFLALIFVMLMLLHFSVRISALERNLTALVQELGLMTVERGERQRELEKPAD